MLNRLHTGFSLLLLLSLFSVIIYTGFSFVVDAVQYYNIHWLPIQVLVVAVQYLIRTGFNFLVVVAVQYYNTHWLQICRCRRSVL